MKARPILFSAPMVRALLDGKKTQTRRIVAPQPIKDGECWHYKGSCWGGDRIPLGPSFHSPLDYCKYQVGDLLWVRESIAYQWPASCDDGLVYPDNEGMDVHEFGRPIRKEECDVIYRATDDGESVWTGDDGEPCSPRWRPSIHMPRWASRLTLEVTKVRAERLQDINEDDAVAEGIERLQGGATVAYRNLWETINGPSSWAADPWVWALTFVVHQKNIDVLLAEQMVAA